MSFSPHPGQSGHLDLTGDREVVYCHRCANEWYKDEHGLLCPRCDSEICEIISPENDPRDIQPDSPGSFPDPEEEMIDAFPTHDNLFRSSDRTRRDRGGRGPIDPSSEEEVFTRFQETLNMLMGGPVGPAGRSNRETLFGGPGNTQTRTFVSPGGRATFSVTTSRGSPGLRHMDHDHDDEFEMYGHPHSLRRRSAMPGIPEVTFISMSSNADRRPRIFGNALGGGNVRPPHVGQPGLENGLQGLFSLLLGPGLMGPHAVHGDAVYSQEALDRIITQLMENNPQSNAAPPASDDAIQRLEKKKLDKEMMGDSTRAECTICIDEINLGDEVTVLPCKHWFHEECVVLWLKEHNTCPICRAPIEKREGNGNGEAGGGPGNRRRGASQDGPSGSDGPRFGGWFSGGGGGSANPWAADAGGSMSGGGPYQTRGARSPEERERRLNAILNLAGPSSYGQPQPESSRQRRDSWSPTSPPRGPSSARHRSPTRPRAERTNSSSWSSQRSGRSSHNSGGNGTSSSNPISWLRDRLSSASGGNANNNGPSRRRS